MTDNKIVPPAGGEPEVYAYMVRKPNGSDHLDFENEYPSDAGYKISELIRREDHRAHVTRLQAEVERLKQQSEWRGEMASSNEAEYTKQLLRVDALQSELTKARECIDHVLGLLRADKPTHAQHAIIIYQGAPSNEFNQSAPADKE